MCLAIKVRLARWRKINIHTRDMVRHAAIVLCLRLLGMGLNLIFAVLAAKYLSAAGAGIFFLSMTIITIASLIGRGGMDNLLLRQTAASIAEGDWPEVARLSQNGMRLSILLSSGLTLMIWISAPWSASAIFADPALAGTLRVLALSLVPFNLAYLAGELLKGSNRLTAAALIQSTCIPLLGVAILLVMGRSTDPALIALAYVVASALAGLLARFAWQRTLPRRQAYDRRMDLRGIAAAGQPFFWISMASLIMSSIDTLVLGFAGTSAEVGIYSIAVRSASLLSIPMLVVGGVVSGKFAALHSQGRHAELEHVARMATAVGAIVVLPLLTVSFALPRQILGLFGPEFAGGVGAFLILGCGQMLNTLAGSVGLLLLMSGYETTVRTVMFGTTVFGIGLTLALIPALGILGAAIANMLTIVALNGAFSLVLYSKLGMIILPLPGSSRRRRAREMARSDDHRSIVENG